MRGQDRSVCNTGRIARPRDAPQHAAHQTPDESGTSDSKKVSQNKTSKQTASTSQPKIHLNAQCAMMSSGVSDGAKNNEAAPSQIETPCLSHCLICTPVQTYSRLQTCPAPSSVVYSDSEAKHPTQDQQPSDLSLGDGWLFTACPAEHATSCPNLRNPRHMLASPATMLSGCDTAHSPCVHENRYGRGQAAPAARSGAPPSGQHVRPAGPAQHQPLLPMMPRTALLQAPASTLCKLQPLAHGARGQAAKV